MLVLVVGGFGGCYGVCGVRIASVIGWCLVGLFVFFRVDGWVGACGGLLMVDFG